MNDLIKYFFTAFAIIIGMLGWTLWAFNGDDVFAAERLKALQQATMTEADFAEITGAKPDPDAIEKITGRVNVIMAFKDTVNENNLLKKQNKMLEEELDRLKKKAKPDKDAAISKIDCDDKIVAAIEDRDTEIARLEGEADKMALRMADLEQKNSAPVPVAVAKVKKPRRHHQDESACVDQLGTCYTKVSSLEEKIKEVEEARQEAERKRAAAEAERDAALQQLNDERVKRIEAETRLKDLEAKIDGRSGEVMKTPRMPNGSPVFCDLMSSANGHPLTCGAGPPGPPLAMR